MIKFSKKIQLIKESNSNPITKLIFDYRDKIESIEKKYNHLFIDTIRKILLSYFKYNDDNDGILDFTEIEGSILNLSDRSLFVISMNDRGIIEIQGETYDDDMEHETNWILGDDIGTYFISEILYELSERDYIMKYFLSELSYGALKKINK